jgi:hypothetical protein
MSKFDKCIEGIRKSSDGQLNEFEARALLEAMVKELDAVGADRLAEIEMGVLKKTAQSKLVKQIGYIRNSFAEKKAVSFLLAEGKSESAFKMGYQNLIRNTEARTMSYKNQFEQMIAGHYQKIFGKDSGLHEFFTPGKKHDTKKLAQFVAELSDGGKRAVNSLSEEDQALYKMAKVIKATQDEIRVRQEYAGIPVKYLAGRIGYQTWDAIKLAGNKDTFIAKALSNFDWQRMSMGNLSTEAKTKWLDDFFDQVQNGTTEEASDLAVFQIKNLKTKQANRSGASDYQDLLTQSRQIHVKAEYWDEMQQEFGGGDILTGLQEAMARTAKNLALIDNFGTNPKAGIENIMRAYKAQNPEIKVLGDFLDTSTERKQFGELIGEYDKPNDFMLARVAATGRKLSATVALGGSAIAQIADVPVKAMRKAVIAGGSPVNQLKAFTGELVDSFKLVKAQYGDEVAKQILETAQEQLEDTIFNLSRQYRMADIGTSAAEVGGKYNHGVVNKSLNAVDKFSDIMYKFNFMEQMTLASKKGAYVSIGRDFGMMSAKTYNQLPDVQKQMLTDLKIRPDEWDFIRTKAAKAENGRTYVTPDALDNLTDDEIKAFLSKRGVKDPSKSGMDLAKRELKTNWQAAFGQEADNRVITPGATVRAKTTHVFGANQRGTVSGEIARGFAQLKSFPVALVQQVIGPALARKQHFALGTFAATSIALWTGLRVVQDLLSNKTPRDLWIDGDEDSGTVLKNWSGILGAAVGVPFTQEIVQAVATAATEGTGAAGMEAGRTLLGIAGPLNANLIKTGLSVGTIVGGTLGLGNLEGEDAGKAAMDIATNAPIIGPALYGHFLARTLKATVYDSFFELWDENYSDRMEKAAEKQGSEIIFE